MGRRYEAELHVGGAPGQLNQRAVTLYPAANTALTCEHLQKYKISNVPNTTSCKKHVHILYSEQENKWVISNITTGSLY